MRPIVLLPIIWLLNSFLYGQVSSFSQFYNLRAALNPAYVSVASGVELTTGYRRQWGQVQDGFRTAYAAAAIRSCHLPLGFGLYGGDLHDPFFGYRQQEAGVQVGGFFGPGKDRWSFHLAGQAGIGQHRVDYQQLLFSGQLDPLFGVVGSPVTFLQGDGARVQTFEVGIGGVFRSPIRPGGGYEMPAAIGFVVQHAAGGHDVSFLRLGRGQSTRIIGHAAVTFPLSAQYDQRAVVYLNALLRMEWESTLRRGMAGFILQYDAVNFGLLYHSNRNPVNSKNTNVLSLVLGGHLVHNQRFQMQLQYSYDGPLGGLGQASSGGGHELTAIFSFPQTCVLRGVGDKGRNKRGSTDCFHFAGKGYTGFF